MYPKLDSITLIGTSCTFLSYLSTHFWPFQSPSRFIAESCAANHSFFLLLAQLVSLSFWPSSLIHWDIGHICSPFQDFCSLKDCLPYSTTVPINILLRCTLYLWSCKVKQHLTYRQGKLKITVPPIVLWLDMSSSYFLLWNPNWV